MASDQLPKRGFLRTIEAEWTNVINRVCSTDVFPRNPSGAVEAGQGSLGSSASRWLNAWFTSLKIVADDGDAATINPPAALGSSYTVTAFDELPAQAREFRISSTGQMTTESDWVKSSACESHSVTYDSGVFEDVTNLSVSVTTNTDEKVLFLVVPVGDSTNEKYGHFLLYNGGALVGGHGRIRLKRTGAASENSDYIFSMTATQLALPSFLMFWDSPPAGTHTYKIQADGEYFSFHHCRLVALKL